MLIKSKKAKTHLDDLYKTFDTLRRYRMKLNLNKCVFGVSPEKFLDFMVSQQGIKVNPENVKAILDTTSPRTIKKVQRLIGRIATLDRLIFKATNKYLLFFKTLKQAFRWADKCKTTFWNLKEYLAKPPLLSSFLEGEDLFLYLVVSQTAVSSALICEESKAQ